MNRETIKWEKKLKIGILANCQGGLLASNLQELPGVEVAFHLAIHEINDDNFIRSKEQFENFLQDENAIILTQIIVDDAFGEYKTEKLRQNSKAKVLTISNIYFNGLHPDITYVGAMGTRFLSPVTDYHSKIVLTSFFQGKSIQECFESFNAETYKKMNYFKQFELSINELRKRDGEVDIPFVDEFVALIKTVPTLYSINHPLAYIYQKYTALVAKKLSLIYHDFPLDYRANTLALSAWWPIYPEIAEYHNISYEVPFVFKKPNNFQDGKLLSLESFIEQSYFMYENDDSNNDLINTSTVQQLIKSNSRSGYILPITKIPTTLQTSSKIHVEVEIHNDTNILWEGHPLRYVNLSYHWLYSNGDMLLFDGVRSQVQNISVPAHGKAYSSMEIFAPKEEGNYKLQITMVEELVDWFENLGFNPFEIEIEVKLHASDEMIANVNVAIEKSTINEMSSQFQAPLISLNSPDIEFAQKLGACYVQEERVKKRFKTAIIHFGGDKTGSTSVQNACHKNKDILEQQGVFYPLFLWHYQLASYVCKIPEKETTNVANEHTNSQWLKKRDEEYIQALDNYLVDKNGDSLVFSYEGFPHLDQDELEDLKHFVLQYAEECLIVYYVRDPKSYVLSVMSERVKAGFYALDQGNPVITKYDDDLKKISLVFGKKNINVRLFDKEALMGNDVVFDFLSLLDLPTDIIEDITNSTERENSSLSMEGLLIGEKILDILSTIERSVSRSVFYQTFANLLARIKGQKNYLTQEQADKISLASKTQVDYLRTEFGIVFPESKQKYHETNNVTISDETAESIAKILVDLAAPELVKGQNKEVSSSEFQLCQAILKEGYDIVHGQALCFEVEFALDREVAELEAGIHIWDTQKQWAFGVNSTLQKQVMYSVAPGIYRVSHYVVADLPEGVYTAGFAFAEKLSDGSSNELMWYDKLCEFRVSHPSDRVGVGYANLPSMQMLTQIDAFVKNVILNATGRIVSMTIPVTMQSSENITIDVEIHNDTDVAWKGDLFRPINLSYRWLDENDDVILLDGVRTPVPDGGVPAQGSVTATMQIMAPETEGVYRLVLTMVQESVRWFEEMGFQPFVIDIMVK